MTTPPVDPAGPPADRSDPDRTQTVRPLRPPRPPGRPAPAPLRASPGRDWRRATTRALVAIALAALAGIAFWALHEAAGRGTSERRAEALAAELGSLQRELAQAEQRVETAQGARDEAIAAAGRAVEPQAAAALVELGADREGRAIETEIELESAAPTILLLRPARRLVDPAFVVEILDVRGATVWRGERPRRDRGDRLAVVLPPASLAVGRYEVRLSGARAGVESALASWPIQIVSLR